MKRALLHIVLLAAALVCAAGCLQSTLSDKTEAHGAAALSVQLLLEAGGEIDLTAVRVTVQNKEMPFSYTVHPDAEGRAALELQPGRYGITASAYFPWHTGMIPILAKKEYTDEYHNSIKHVFTIHNLAFQGNFPRELMNCFNLHSKYWDNGDLKFDTGMSFMKGALTYADKITTVSNSYAGEILSPEYGERMEGPLSYRRNDLWGIVNGIDVESWNPATDPDIYANYSLKSMANKKKCKADIQRRLGLREDPNVLLMGMVSRLTWQKGASLLIEKMSQIMGQDVQLIILGSGDNYIENQLKRIEFDYPHRAVFYCGYDEALSHSIYAGVDLFLMPSLFEPCGISQLISMRYGTLPLVREVGGLRDTVIPYNEYTKQGTGFTFKNFSGDDFIYMIKYAIEVYYYRKDDWKQMMKNAMKEDVSWEKSCLIYDQLYSCL